jgi:hypothetical protein
MKLERHSPSSLNLFAASPAMWVLERVLGKRQPVGAPAHRGVAVEEGVAWGLKNPGCDPQDCINIALMKFDQLIGASHDIRGDKYRASIEVMVLRALKELLPYGVPSAMQKFVEWHPEGLKCPIVGYLDFEWENHGILTDLKTTDRMPEAIKITHARQVALYANSDNLKAAVTYVTPGKVATYGAVNLRDHREALHKIALTVERFVGLTNDPKELVALVVPDLESFYWKPPAARQEAFNIWGI